MMVQFDKDDLHAVTYAVASFFRYSIYNFSCSNQLQCAFTNSSIMYMQYGRNLFFPSFLQSIQYLFFAATLKPDCNRTPTNYSEAMLFLQNIFTRLSRKMSIPL